MRHYPGLSQVWDFAPAGQRWPARLRSRVWQIQYRTDRLLRHRCAHCGGRLPFFSETILWWHGAFYHQDCSYEAGP